MPNHGQKVRKNLTAEHWDAIIFLRQSYINSGICPTFFAVCKASNLRPWEIKALFPPGYHRGLCRIAGVHYRTGGFADDKHLREAAADLEALSGDKHCKVDVRGFLIDPDSWDPHYALHLALEMKIPDGRLNEEHWRVIDYLRDVFQAQQRIATIHEACEGGDLDLDVLERLFPDGYHRRALKIAGLRFA